MTYRNDIDGLRAISVFAVMFFHLGYLPNGYLGVDVFFVISGYLITGIIYNQSLRNEFSILNFYKKRIRRIIPLVTVSVIVSLIIGLLVMLPNDLENLAQSIIATNLFSNNIIQAITTKDYWNIINEYKPLMHTWSLAIEEQYYILYPFIFFGIKKSKYIILTISLFTIISLVLFFMPFSEELKFYYLPFRFFELSFGGLLAIILNGKLFKSNYGFIFIMLLILIMTFDFGLSNDLLILFTVILSCSILVSENNLNKISNLILQNKFFVFAGKISFSLYMWHQICYSYTRYFITNHFDFQTSSILLILVFLLSVFSYYWIEQPFRNKKIFSNKKAISIILFFTFLTTIISFVIYEKGGLIRDVPQLSLSLGKHNDPKVHEKYNDRNYLLNKDFESKDKIKVLVIGDSFSRDWINILIESDFSKRLEISYLELFLSANFNENYLLTKRVKNADIIFVSRLDLKDIQKYMIPISKTYCIGDKNFGENNGIFYNSSNIDFCYKKTKPSKKVVLRNLELKSQWKKNAFIDLLDLIKDENDSIPVFNKDCKFLSNDTKHLTQSGAILFGQKVKPQLEKIFNETNYTRS